MGGRGSAAAVAASDAPWNGLGACRACHAWIEAEPTAARVLGWKLPHGADPAAEPAFLRTMYGDGWFLLGPAGEYTATDPPTCDGPGGVPSTGTPPPTAREPDHAGPRDA